MQVIITKNDTIAIGRQAGLSSQALNAVAIGTKSGQSSQGQSSIAIGFEAGYQDQANSSGPSIAIGNKRDMMHNWKYQ